MSCHLMERDAYILLLPALFWIGFYLGYLKGKIVTKAFKIEGQSDD